MSLVDLIKSNLAVAGVVVGVVGGGGATYYLVRAPATAPVPGVTAPATIAPGAQVQMNSTAPEAPTIPTRFHVNVDGADVGVCDLMLRPDRNCLLRFSQKVKWGSGTNLITIEFALDPANKEKYRATISGLNDGIGHGPIYHMTWTEVNVGTSMKETGESDPHTWAPTYIDHQVRAVL